MTQQDKCDYCGRFDCHRCINKVKMDILNICDALEQAMLKPDATDEIGINNHLRAAWGARDAINDLLT